MVSQEFLETLGLRPGSASDGALPETHRSESAGPAGNPPSPDLFTVRSPLSVEDDEISLPEDLRLPDFADVPDLLAYLPLIAVVPPHCGGVSA